MLRQSSVVERRTRAARDSREQVNLVRVRKFLSMSMSAPVDEPFICTLNHLSLRGFPEHERSAGFYRSTNVVVKDNGRVVLSPPGPEKVPGLMKAFVQRINSPPSSASPYVARMAASLAEFFEIHPFFEANGRTGRALVTFLLEREGFVEREGRALEAAFDSDYRGYFETLDQAHQGDPLPWLRFFARAVEEAMRPPPGLDGV
jgi:Fic family protein